MRFIPTACVMLGCVLASSAAAQDRYVIAGSARHAEAVREVIAHGAAVVGTNHRGDTVVTLDADQAERLSTRVRSLARVKRLDTELIRVPVVHSQALAATGDPTTSSDTAAAWLRSTRLLQGRALVERGITVGLVDTGGTWTPGVQELQGHDFASTNFGETRVTRGQLAENGWDPEPADIGDALSETSGTSSWHGTSVASVIAGAEWTERGLFSVNPGGTVVFARALWVVKDRDPGSPKFGEPMRGGYWDDIVAAAKWLAGLPVQGVAVLNPTPVRVINMSFSTKDVCHPYWAQDFLDLRARGVVVVVAAGNGRENSEHYFPGNCPGAIAVGAIGEDGSIASYSNFGPGTTVMAPGGGNGSGVTAWTNTGLRLPNVGDGSAVTQGVRGTSFSAPFVSGVVALMLAANPTLSAEAVQAVLMHTAQPLPDFQGAGDAGLVNVEAAVRMARAGGISVPPAVRLGALAARVSVVNTESAALHLAGAYLTGSAAAALAADARDCMQPVNPGRLCELRLHRVTAASGLATLNLDFSDGRSAQVQVVVDEAEPPILPAPPAQAPPVDPPMETPAPASGGGGTLGVPLLAVLTLVAWLARGSRKEGHCRSDAGV